MGRRPRIQPTRQRIVGTISNIERFLEILRPNYGDNWPKDFFLGNYPIGCNASEDCRSNEVARIRCWHFQSHFCLLTPFFDILPDTVSGIGINYRPHLGTWSFSWPNVERSRCFHHAFHKGIIHGFQHNHPRTSRTLLTAIPKRRLHHTRNCLVEVSTFIHNNRVLPSHLSNYALQMLLPWLHACCLRENSTTHLKGTCTSN